MTPLPTHDTDKAIRALWADQDHYACLYPELHMRVWATPQGMRAVAALWLPGPKFGRRVQVIQEATWQPKEVTQELVVEWGRRALADWLARQLQDVLNPPGDQQL